MGFLRRAYPLLKMFVLAFLLATYVLFLATISVAYFSGGWVVVLIDRYREGLWEVTLLFAVLPLASYVVIREMRTSYREIKKIRRSK